MTTIPKHQVGLVGRHELVARVVAYAAFFAQLGESEAVELRGGWVVGAVGVDGGCGDFKNDARRNVLAVGERDAFKDAPVEGG